MAGTQSEVEMIAASVYLVRDGRVARVEHYGNRAEALEALGLRE
jgi:ketosteroid isomerase-like protein